MLEISIIKYAGQLLVRPVVSWPIQTNFRRALHQPHRRHMNERVLNGDEEDYDVWTSQWTDDLASCTRDSADTVTYFTLQPQLSCKYEFLLPAVHCRRKSRNPFSAHTAQLSKSYEMLQLLRSASDRLTRLRNEVLAISESPFT